MNEVIKALTAYIGDLSRRVSETTHHTLLNEMIFLARYDWDRDPSKCSASIRGLTSLPLFGNPPKPPLHPPPTLSESIAKTDQPTSCSGGTKSSSSTLLDAFRETLSSKRRAEDAAVPAPKRLRSSDEVSSQRLCQLILQPLRVLRDGSHDDGDSDTESDDGTVIAKEQLAMEALSAAAHRAHAYAKAVDVALGCDEWEDMLEHHELKAMAARMKKAHEDAMAVYEAARK
jgi:hypothetical protein